MARRYLVAGNWKMHKGVSDTATFLEQLLAAKRPRSVDVVVCPPYISLPAAAMLLTRSGIGLGAQNVHWETSGAFTGEISAPMLRDLEVEWVIVGHSERRAMFGETDETAAKRARRAQEDGLTVIFCLGETLEQREAGETMEVLRRQASVLGELDPAKLVVAYEPIWAIGTGQTASPAQAEEAHAFLRAELVRQLGQEAANTIRILYGGSVKPGNAAELFGQPDVDGGLIGGASLDVPSFSAIIRAAAHLAAGESS